MMNKNIKDKKKKIKPKKDKGLYIYDFELGRIDISIPKSKEEAERREKELRKRIEYQNNLRKPLTRKTDESIKDWTNKAEKAFNFAVTARQRFEDGGLDTKNEILRNLDTNVVIKDLEISLEVDAPLIVMKKAKPEFEQAMRTLEPLKWSTDKEEIKVLMSKNR